MNSRYDPWNHRHFQKDKLRVKERYYHQYQYNNSSNSRLLFGEDDNNNSSSSSIIVIPDGKCWRRYLSLFQYLIESQWEKQDQEQYSPSQQQQQQQQRQQQPQVLLKFVLLESAAELMDWRNLNPCLQQQQRRRRRSISQQSENNISGSMNGGTIIKESTAPRERTKIIKLVEQQQQRRRRQQQQQQSLSSSTTATTCCSTILQVFCDLSVREEECDEWDILGYSTMNVIERSRQALFRAARMLIQQQQDNNYYHRRQSTSSTPPPPPPPPPTTTTTTPSTVILLVDNDEGLVDDGKNFSQPSSLNDDDDDDDERIVTMNMNGFLEYLRQHQDELLILRRDAAAAGGGEQQLLLSVSATMEGLSNLRIQCDEEYNRRNKIIIVSSDDNNNNNNNNNGDDNDNNAQQQQQQEEYWSQEQVQSGLQRGELIKGRLEVTKFNPKEGFVTSSSSSSGGGIKQYFINQRNNHFNRALHGDIVIVKILPESNWGRPIGKRRLVFNVDNNKDDESNEELNNNNNDATNQQQQTPVPSARVVALAAGSGADTSSRRSMYVATLVDIPLHDESHILLVPMDIRIPKIRINTKIWRKYTNQRLLVQIDGWDISSTYPHGRVVEIVGPIGDLEVEIKCLLIENGILLDPFSTAAKACLPPEGDKWTVPPEEITNRRDLRYNRRIFSVDPPGCQDIDDTMHAEVLPNGDIEVGVHIADVTHFVSHNSALDVEAQKRGTTFYLVDRRFDMLPSLLSSDLCSLHGEVDRLAVSVIWTLSKDLETVKSVWYGRTVIHNCQAMTYDQAHNILHDKPPDDPGKPVPPPLTAGYPVDRAKVPQLKEDLTILRDLGRLLKKRREEIGGAVDLSSGDLGGELKFTLDENGNPVQVKSKKELEIHHTIAEMMIYANGYVASKIYDSFPEEALLRIHRSVEQSRFDSLKNVLDVGGVSLEGSSNRELANTLKKVENAGAVVNSLIKSLATRAMSEAQYICTGKQKDGLNLLHYGLGVDRYTHFTSPIRRYADVVVHKQLMAALRKDMIVAKERPSTVAKSFPKAEVAPLAAIPDSNVISIMAGEGIDEAADTNDLELGSGDDLDLDADDFLDSLIEGASELALGVPNNDDDDDDDSPLKAQPDIGETGGKATTTEENKAEEKQDDNLKPYGGTQVALIADNLNRQTRVAKHSSMECQNLFLSLYFRDNEEIAQGVVTDLRVNGFFVYIPKFDISGPVYVRDVNGDVQIDPSFLGLGANAGQAATMAFAASDTCRRFPSGQCKLVEAADGSPGGGRLEVSVPESKQKFVVCTVDVVTIALRCDNWDVRSRVPPPRFLLVGKGSRPPPGFGQPATKKITSQVLAEDHKRPARDSAVATRSSSSPQKTQFGSMFDALQSWETPPLLPDVPLRGRGPTKSRVAATLERQEDFKGRMIFHKFVNPDTKSAKEEAAQSAAASAAAKRRANANETRDRRNEVDTVRTIERNVMARTQRLAAEKRNARRSKAK